MVTETLVKEALSRELIDAGKRLTLLLDEKGFAVTAALWFFRVESGSWRFVIASPVVDSKGPKESYKRVQNILASTNDGDLVLGLKDISLVSPSDPLISLLKRAMKTGKGVSGIRFSGNLINGIPIEDAYIYRLT